jgi:trehalose 6-phosphate phosphatase
MTRLPTSSPNEPDSVGPRPAWSTVMDTLLQPFSGPGRIGLVSDVDGTLSPIVPRPDDARVTPRARELLAALRPHLSLLAVISGRAVADVQARVGVPGLVYVGNHGLERWQDGRVIPAPAVAAFRPALETAREALEARLRPGMQVEDKGATLSVHTRQALDPDAADAEFGPIAEAIAAENGLRLFRGRRVFELRPPLEIDKGSALRGLVSEFHLEAVLYIGDDTTDVDALRACAGMRAGMQADLRDSVPACYGLGVGVAAEETPRAVLEAADVLADGVSGVEELLAWLLDARASSSARRQSST